MISLKSISQAEKEIKRLLGLNEANWKQVAKISIEVQKEELYKGKYKSFTAWVNNLAQLCDRNPRLIWRYIKAGKYYLETVDSENVDDIDQAIAAPEALVNLEKIQRHAPEPVFAQLKDRVLGGDVSVSESREIEQQYRPERSPKVTAIPQVSILTDEETDEEVVTVEKTVSQSSTSSLSSSTSERTADLIANTLKVTIADWSKRSAGMRYPPKFSQAHTEVRVSHEKKRLRLDLVAVVRWSFKKPKDVFGVEIKSSLHDFESDRKWENYLHFCDFFCFAILGGDSELREAIEEHTDTNIGILEINFNSRIANSTKYYNGEYYRVDVYRRPKRLKSDSVSLIYETLYERLAGWSGSETQGSSRTPRNPNKCNPVIGNRVFSVKYAFDGWDKPQWYTVGAIDKNDASEYIRQLKITTSGEKPNILEIIEQFYNPQTRMWDQKWKPKD
ncbi:MAG: MmcB family DNA repair protein [Cyanobacteria bacterium P01_A01_bin.40]